MHADGDWLAVEGVLNKDMATLGEYLQTWTLKLSTTKTVSAAFHLNNKEAKRELKVNFNNETLPFCSEPKYLGVTLDRSLTYRRHLESLRKKLWMLPSNVQTVDHVALQCPIHQPPHGLHGLTVLDDETTEWLLNTCPKIYRGRAVDKRRTRSKEEDAPSPSARIQLSYVTTYASHYYVTTETALRVFHFSQRFSPE